MSGTDGPAIELVGVTKRYADTTALADFSLDIHRGEFFVLLGPSGCGKSTVLKVVAGLEDATGGEVYIDGRLVNYVAPRARDVAMVFQNYALYPHMTVEQNIGFPLRMTGRPKAEVRERVAAVAGSLGLELSKYPDQLSGGQRQRVAVGRALVRDPVVFLMDEPLSNLDALLRVQMRDELLRLHRRVGRAMVYVTHDQVEAMAMADRIAVMRSGTIEQLGTPEEVYRRPATTFVASFVGTPQMNLFPGRLEDGAVVSPAGRIPLDEGRLDRVGGPELTVGARAEDLRLGGAGAGDDGAVPGSVALVEALGADSFVHVTLGGDASCVVRADAMTRLAVGERVGVRFPLAELHLFDGAGRRVEPER